MLLEVFVQLASLMRWIGNFVHERCRSSCRSSEDILFSGHSPRVCCKQVDCASGVYFSMCGRTA